MRLILEVVGIKMLARITVVLTFCVTSSCLSVARVGAGKLPLCSAPEKRLWDNCYGYFTNRAGSFEGEFRGGVVNGFGTFQNKNGNTYSGEWKNAHFDGLGTLAYSNGRKYTGHWLRDKRAGFGVETFPDGTKKEGEWIDDRYTGTGKSQPRSDLTVKNEQINSGVRNPESLATNEVALIDDNGTYKIPVLINGSIKLDFTVDSGASDVSIPADVVLVMMRAGSLTKNDFLGSQTYRLADGTRVPSQVFRISSLTVGGRTVENVTGSMASVNGSLLLGQSFLRKFKSVSFDYQRKVLVLQ